MKKRFSEEQIVRILREAETAKETVAQMCKARGISEQTRYRGIGGRHTNFEVVLDAGA